MIEHKEETISSITQNQTNEKDPIKRIRFDKETLKNLKTIIYRESLDDNRKSDDILSEIINTLANEYIKKYFEKNFKI